MKSILSWTGGKSRLRNSLVARMPEHTCYVEPFMGAAWVFFGKAPSKREVLNDLDSELVNLFHVVQNDPTAFVKATKYFLASRRLFDLLRLQDARTMSPAARAARLYFLVRTSFGSKRTDACFTGKQSRVAFGDSAMDVIERVHRRLQGVIIECLPAIDVLERYDSASSFFYLDPPYYEVSNPYVGVMSHEDQVALRDALRNIRGKFLLTINDRPFTRRLYRKFVVDRLRAPYSIPRNPEARAKMYSTLVVGNYEHRQGASAVRGTQ